MPVLLLHAHEEARVALLPELDRPLQAQVPRGHGLRQALQLESAFRAARLEHARLHTNVGNGHLAGRWRGLDTQAAGIGALKPQIYRAKVASRPRLTGGGRCVGSPAAPRSHRWRWDPQTRGTRTRSRNRSADGYRASRSDDRQSAR